MDKVTPVRWYGEKPKSPQEGDIYWLDVDKGIASLFQNGEWHETTLYSFRS